MKGKIDAQTRKDPGASYTAGGGGPVLSPWVAEEYNRVSGQELAEEEVRLRADFVQKAKEREMEPRKQFKVFSPVEIGSSSTDVADTHWALTWRQVGGAKTVQARLVARIFVAATWISRDA